MRVIFHVDELEKWQLTLSNVNNLLTYAKEQQEVAEIIILANSVAVSALSSEGAIKNNIEEQLQSLLANHVGIAACRNALKKENIEESTLITNVNVVPAGVAELVKKQAEGFAYIRP